MKKWHLIIDVAKCENCNNCFLACKDEHCGNEWPGYAAGQPLHDHRWMNILRRERGEFPVMDVAYLPKPCMHCDKAPCIEAARNGAVYKRPDGIVIIDPERAKGQQQLMSACPYGAIWWNDQENLPQKCTLCAHLLDDGWKAPRCVQACPTGALSIGRVEPEELGQIKRRQGLAVLGPDTNPTRPRVFYKNLYRFNRCFIADSVAGRTGDLEECLPDLNVRLIKADQVLDQTRTDAFGDFMFEGLSPNSGAYRIGIFKDGEGGTSIAVNLKSSLSLGTIWI
jgi:Fe-S-cluster-containing dehydrogenase component